MTIKFILERSAKPGKKDELLELLRQLRAKAIHQPGYITGETLTSVDKPGTHIVISTWYSLSNWRAWENHPDRLELLPKIEALLTASPKVAVFMEPWASLPEGI